MIRRLDKSKSSIGIVVDEETEDIQFCSTCAANGEMSKLKERIYLNEKGKRLPSPPDADSYRQCWTCGLVVPVRDVKHEGKISGIQGIETIDNPFDEKKGLILGNDSKHRYQNLKRRQNKHPDKEVQKYLDDGYELTSYLSSMPT